MALTNADHQGTWSISLTRRSNQNIS